MAITYCRSCKHKITRMDATCPRCGATQSRLMPVFIGIVVVALCAITYNAFSKSKKNQPMDVVVNPSSKASIDRTKSFVAGAEENQ